MSSPILLVLGLGRRRHEPPRSRSYHCRRTKIGRLSLALALSCVGAVGMTARRTMPSSRSEEVDDYHTVVAKLNDNWRIIVCTSGIQWILQRRVGERHGTPRWESRCFCRTSEALNRLSRGRAGAIDPSADATLVSLPERISTSSRLSEN
jgi:hypothetical protein